MKVLPNRVQHGHMILLLLLGHDIVVPIGPYFLKMGLSELGRCNFRLCKDLPWRSEQLLANQMTRDKHGLITVLDVNEQHMCHAERQRPCYFIQAS